MVELKSFDVVENYDDIGFINKIGACLANKIDELIYDPMGDVFEDQSDQNQTLRLRDVFVDAIMDAIIRSEK